MVIRVSKHTIVTPKEYKRGNYVDHAGIGGREKLLPGDILSTTGGKGKKSAEAILATSNEPRIETVEASPR